MFDIEFDHIEITYDGEKDPDLEAAISSAVGRAPDDSHAAQHVYYDVGTEEQAAKIERSVNKFAKAARRRISTARVEDIFVLAARHNSARRY